MKFQLSNGSTWLIYLQICKCTKKKKKRPKITKTQESNFTVCILQFAKCAFILTCSYQNINSCNEECEFRKLKVFIWCDTVCSCYYKANCAWLLHNIA